MPGQSPKLKAKRGFLPLACALVLTACGDCPDSFELTERVVVAPDQAIVLELPDGELNLIGRERSRAVEIEARGCRARGGARVERDTVGGALRVVARHADVRVVVPAGIELTVDHGSGDVEMRAVGPMRLVTRGGDVRVEQSIGGLSVRSGPGTLYVREVVGDVEIADGPGAVFVENVAGSVRLRDGSGGLHLKGIEGDVLVERDGSGAIEAHDIAGDFTLESKSDDLRMVRHDDVGGRVRLPEIPREALPEERDH